MRLVPACRVPTRTPYRSPVGYRGGQPVYFDSAAAGGGTGSYSAPYNTLAALNTITGNQNGKVFLLKRGSIFNHPIAINGAWNFRIGIYGDSGARPIVSMYRQVTLSWTDDTGAMTNRWYTTQAAFGNGAYSCGLVLSPTTDIRLGKYLHDRGTPASCNLVYEDPMTGSNWVWTKSYETASGGRHYVVTDGTDPNTMVAFRPHTNAELTALGIAGATSASSSLSLGNCPGVTVQGIDLIGGRANVASLGGCDDFLAEDVDLYWGGADNGITNNAQDGWSIVGDSGDFANNTLLRRCRVWDLMGTGSQSGGVGRGHGVEISYLSNFLMEDSLIYNVGIYGIELWNSCTGVTVRRNRMLQCGVAGSILRGPLSTTHHQNVLFQNNIIIAGTTFAAKGAAGSGSRSSGGFYHGSTDNYLYMSDVRYVNNTIVTDEAGALFHYYNNSGVGAGSNATTLKNTPCLQRQLASNGYGGYESNMTLNTGVPAATTVTTNYNVYQNGRDTHYFTVNGFRENFANAKAAWDGISGKESNEDNSHVVAIATAMIANLGGVYATNVQPINGSAFQIGKADTSDPDYPATDFSGATRTRATVGAYD